MKDDSTGYTTTRLLQVHVKKMSHVCHPVPFTSLKGKPSEGSPRHYGELLRSVQPNKSRCGISHRTIIRRGFPHKYLYGNFQINSLLILVPLDCIGTSCYNRIYILIQHPVRTHGVLYYAIRTKGAYMHWIKRFILFPQQAPVA